MRRVTIGDVVLAFQAAEQSRGSLVLFFRTLGRLYEGTLFAESFLKFLDMPMDSVSGALSRKDRKPGVSCPRPIRQGIEFRKVSFRYPETEREVLQDVSFTIEAQKNVAVVGQNGAGKTTIVKLLSRFYDPTEGEILLDGKDLREYRLDDLRVQIGVIFQDYMRYDLTLGENIGIGSVADLSDRQRIKEAARQGGVADIAKKLPNGLDTMLGRTLEEGVDLSGGEWQRLALSRAFMRDGQIMILDEPSAALDAFSEFELFRRFADLTTGKTTVLISHRFSTVRLADQILA